jgi:electron transport complex protein RnfD
MTNEHWIVGNDWPAKPAPHRRSGSTHRDILRAWLFAASIVAACGVLLFGHAALLIIGIAVLSAVVSEFAIGLALRRPVIGGPSHACLTGLLLGLTLPATVQWYVPLFGSVIAITIGKAPFGGFGHYVWQPALVGRIVVGFLFTQQLSFGGDLRQSPILTPNSLFVGDVHQATPVGPGTYRGWFAYDQPSVSDAWQMERPVQALREFAEGKIPANGDSAYETLLRDYLPPWQDTVMGTVPGGIGETCTIALVIVGLYLIYKGYLRWQLPVAMLATAAVAAAVLPVEIAGSEGSYDWLPVLEAEHGRALGIAYVFYHLTAGQLMLGAFLLGGDMIATPMRTRGQLAFAAGIGAMTIFLRLYGILEGECYWSILIMNSLVAMIDRRMKRPVLGLTTQ